VYEGRRPRGKEAFSLPNENRIYCLRRCPLGPRKPGLEGPKTLRGGSKNSNRRGRGKDGKRKNRDNVDDFLSEGLSITCRSRGLGGGKTAIDRVGNVALSEGSVRREAREGRKGKERKRDGFIFQKALYNAP